MIFKKSTFAVCSNLPSLLPSPHLGHGITSSSCSTNTRWLSCQQLSHISSRQRSYATVSKAPKEPSSSSNEHAWPDSPQPTPYEIFDQHKSAPYSKAKFYELVKIYHPDRHNHVSLHRLSHSTRLERYRLVVAANQVLSDPSKRRAYDLYGAGWGGIHSMENIYRSADRSWRDVPGNPSTNATWEDWERWYNERDGKKEKQRPVYMSNQLFAGVLCIFVVVGSMGQARRANSNTTNLVDMREQSHASINHDMRLRQVEQASLNRHERVENFLRQREGWALAATESPRTASESREK
ncbi:uncharacterized protein F4812DRAFT_357356 [Daldinia caldariorum]|uniref:uncharacterized protein n=1 Tax=Daldinia caldariorum TaxID=326644 RepID=UPI002007642F|nr:uncharacterized protein F4812DRAFT_357356 [Daldinia caldariorum]KAI1468169.1 hypothetical protein F4812DRAFT_357356 [Daldinia caldariorum]